MTAPLVEPKPLFMVGNKRSGTSHLVRLLNLHPAVFLTHESDIVWILYRFHRGEPFEAHPWDSDRGMRDTLERCEPLLRREASPLENFMAVQGSLMRRGSRWLAARVEGPLAWIGDKKPFQHGDPRLIEFIDRHLPGARFIHIVRHPFAVAASSSRFNRARGDFWVTLTDEQKVEQWAFHEERVRDLRATSPDRVLTLRYEDLCRRTADELRRIFSFLEVPLEGPWLREAERRTLPPWRPFRTLPSTPAVERLAHEYGYRLTHAPGLVRTASTRLFWMAAKRFAR